jgi:hypothetical protein
MIDTRDLITEREDHKQAILDSFLEEFPHYEDMTDTFEDIRFEEEEIESWKEEWMDELNAIREIDILEDEVGSEFSYGATLIEEDEFEEYCEEFVTDCGYISRDFPMWIEIDWEATASNMKQDYSEVDFRGSTYLFR